MSQTAAIWLLIVVAAIAANLPFVNRRLFLLGPERLPDKALGWRVLELAVLYVLVLALGFGLEAAIGRRHVQAWEFYVVTLSLFLVLAFPGFVWRYLVRHRPATRAGD